MTTGIGKRTAAWVAAAWMCAAGDATAATVQLIDNTTKPAVAGGAVLFDAARRSAYGYAEVTFLTGASATNVTSMTFDIYGSLNDSGKLRVAIYGVDASNLPTGTPLFTPLLLPLSYSGTGHYQFTYTSADDANMSGYGLAANTKYAIVLSSPWSYHVGSSSDYWSFATTSGTYSSGAGYSFVGSGYAGVGTGTGDGTGMTAWTAYAAPSYEFTFALNGTAVPEPSTAALAVAGASLLGGSLASRRARRHARPGRGPA